MNETLHIPGPVLFFDGECGLCNRCVRLLLRMDRGARLRFAPLQSELAQRYLRSKQLPTEDFDSLVFVPDWNQREAGVPLLRTNGVIGALRAVGGIGAVLAWVRIIPASWRDAAYKLVARWRYRLWGEWKPRPLPRAEWAQRFLQ